MKTTDNNLGGFLQVAPQTKDNIQNAPLINSKPRSQAQKITLPPAAQAARPSIDPIPLDQREARQAKPPPKLLRQVRYAALPSSTQVSGYPRIVNTSMWSHNLPSARELIGKLKPPRTDTLLEQLMHLFGLHKPSKNYQNILTTLEAYHTACQDGTGTKSIQKAMAQLDKLDKLLNQYSKEAYNGPPRVIGSTLTQIVSERKALTELERALQDHPLSQEISLSDALAFKREGVSPKQIHDFLKILAKLDQHHSAYNTPTVGTDADSNILLAEQIKDSLNKLSADTQNYLKTYYKNSHSDAIEILRDQIAIEGTVLQDVIEELKDVGKLPTNTDLSHVLAFARQGVSLKDMDRLIERGLQPSQAADARMLLDSEIASSIVNHRTSLTSEQRTQRKQEFNDDELLLLELSGLGIEGGKEYKRLHIPITRQTVALERTDAQRLNNHPMAVLGTGSRSNKVYQARYSGPDGLLNGVFKSLRNSDVGVLAFQTGIDLLHPQTANRNLATQDIARALGFDVVVDTQIGSRRDPDTQKLEIGLVMERALGETASDTSVEIYDNPEVRREITKLQLLDHLVGQVGRHPGNYFIHLYKNVDGTTNAKVSGIDNDQCFGKNVRDGDDIRYAAYDNSRSAFRGTRMPQLIDTDMATAIHRITPGLLSSILSDKLSEAEVGAAHERLSSLQDHVHSLEKQGQVITTEQWNENAATTAKQNSDNSYVFRDANKQFGW